MSQNKKTVNQKVNNSSEGGTQRNKWYGEYIEQLDKEGKIPEGDQQKKDLLEFQKRKAKIGADNAKKAKCNHNNSNQTKCVSHLHHLFPQQYADYRKSISMVKRIDNPNIIPLPACMHILKNCFATDSPHVSWPKSGPGVHTNGRRPLVNKNLRPGKPVTWNKDWKAFLKGKPILKAVLDHIPTMQNMYKITKADL